jgi:hypothetical protein
MAPPVEWNSNRYTLNIWLDVPNVKSLLIICSIAERVRRWVGLALELRDEGGWMRDEKRGGNASTESLKWSEDSA